jgi:Ser/Thr protein kinase RdoA (MazF antagonist)
MLDEQLLRSRLRRHWGLAAVTPLVPQPEAMNSLVWLLDQPDGPRLVVKAARNRQRLESGLRLAGQVERHGIAAGHRDRPRGGALTVPVGGWAVAVLGFVAGRPLDPSRREDATRAGATLGRLHRVLAALPVPAEVDRWPGAGRPPTTTWPRCRDLAPRSPGQGRGSSHRRPRQADPGLLHTDPAPTAFRVDGRGRVG